MMPAFLREIGAGSALEGRHGCAIRVSFFTKHYANRALGATATVTVTATGCNIIMPTKAIFQSHPSHFPVVPHSMHLPNILTFIKKFPKSFHLPSSFALQDRSIADV